MAAILSNLTKLPGVQGAALFDLNLNCLEHDLHPPYDPIFILRVIENLREGLEPLRYLDRHTVNLLLARTSNGYLVLAQIGNLLVFVLGGNNLNPTMLNVAFSVIPMKLREQENNQTGGRPEPVPRRTIPPSSNLASREELARVTKALTRHLGPIARVFVKKEMKRLGGSETVLERALLPDLVKNLESKIQDTEKKRQYLAEIRELNL